MAEDREKFKELCERLGEPVLPSLIATSMEEGFTRGGANRLPGGAAARVYAGRHGRRLCRQP